MNNKPIFPRCWRVANKVIRTAERRFVLEAFVSYLVFHITTAIRIHYDILSLKRTCQTFPSSVMDHPIQQNQTDYKVHVRRASIDTSGEAPAALGDS